MVLNIFYNIIFFIGARQGDTDMKKSSFCFRGIVVFVLGCALFIFFILSGCTKKYDNARALFDEFCDVYGTLPAGKLFVSTANEWDEEYLSDEIIYSMYTDTRGVCYYDLVAESAIYLCSSPDVFCEFAVFICRDNTDTQAVAKMCHARIDMARELRNLVNTEYSESARVEIFGNVVVMSVLPDAKKAEKAISLLSR